MAIDSETKKAWAGDTWAIDGDRADVEDATPAPAINRNIGFQRAFSVDQTLNREKINQIFCELYSAAKEVQKGVSAWDSTIAYPPTAIAKINDTLYYQGSNSASTGVNPATPNNGVWSVLTGGGSGQPSSVPPALSAAEFSIDGTRADRFNVRWAISNTGGQPITDVEVRYSKTNPPPSNSTSVTSYSQGQEILIAAKDADTYYVQIRFRNSIGWGGWSTAVKVASAPLLPLGPDWITTNKGGSGSVLVGWSGTRDNGLSISTHRIQWKSGTQNYSSARQQDVTNTKGLGPGSATVTGLTNGTAYTFRVLAVSNRGTTNASPDSTATPTQSPAAPDAPAVGSVAISPTSTAIFANANINNNGAGITSFKFEHKLSTQSWTNATTSTSSSSIKVISGLTIGATYNFRISATNSAGTSTPTAGTILLGVLSEPSKAAAKVFRTSDNEAVYCLANASITSGGPITMYRMRYKRTGTSTWGNDVETTDAAGLITGLTGASRYDVQIAARNADGWGAWSDTAIVPAFTTNVVVPSGISGKAIAGEPGVVYVGILGDPDNGGATITNWNWQYRIGAGSWTNANITSDLAFGRIAGLTEGTNYQFQVLATNSVGTTTTAAGAATVNRTPAPVVTKPTNIIAQVRVGQASGTAIVGLGEDPDDGNATISTYQWEYKLSTANTFTAINASSNPLQVITGLTNGSTYNFKVSATNSAGKTTSATVNASPSDPSPSAQRPSRVEAAAANGKSGQIVVGLAQDPWRNGADITTFHWEYKLSTASNWRTWGSATRNPTTTITGLTNGSTYNFRVIARNSVGSTTSDVISRIPADPNPATGPSNIVLTANTGNTGVMIVSINRDIDDGGADITGIVWRHRINAPNNNWTLKPSSLNTTQVFTGLTPGTEYEFGAVVSNSVGGLSSSTTGTPVNLSATTAAPSNVGIILSYGVSGAIVASVDADPDDNNSAITGFQWEYKRHNANTWTSLSSTLNPTRVISGLTNGVSHDFRLSVTNGVGTTRSAQKSETPRSGLPSAVKPSNVNLRAVRGKSGQIVVGIDGDPDNGRATITSFTFQYRAGTSGSFTTIGTSATQTVWAVNGLTNGTSYQFKVTATNSVGATESSTQTLAPADPAPAARQPSSVVIVGNTANTGEVVVSLNRDIKTNGADLTGIVWRYRASTTSTWTTLASSFDTTKLITGLTAGTAYVFEAIASNSAGTTTSNALTVTAVSRTPAATAPSGLVAVVIPTRSGEVAVGLGDDPNDNRANITAFKWEYKLNTANIWTSTSSQTNPTRIISGLTNGSIYNFRVVATNSVGNGTSSQVNATPTGSAVSRPSNLVGAAINPNTQAGQSLFCFLAADPDNGGASITRYDWEYRVSGSSNAFTDAGHTTIPVKALFGLTNGTLYEVQVKASNTAGATTSGLFYGVPAAILEPVTRPSGLIASANLGSSTGTVVCSIGKDPDDGGNTEITYQWQHRISTTSTWTGTSTSTNPYSTNPTRVFTGLTAGATYRFRVRARNSFGSALSTEAVVTIPSTGADTAPKNVDAHGFAGAPGQIIFGLRKDPDDGGKAITAWRWRYRRTGTSIWTNLTSSDNPTARVSGLTQGASYQFSVRATNSVGSTESSIASLTTTSSVATVPTKPILNNSNIIFNEINTQYSTYGIACHANWVGANQGGVLTNWQWRFSWSASSNGANPNLISGNYINFRVGSSNVEYQRLDPYSATIFSSSFGIWFTNGDKFSITNSRYIVAQLRWHNSAGWGPWSNAIVLPITNAQGQT